MFHKLFSADKAIVEDQLRRNAELLSQRHQAFAIALAFTAPDVGVGNPETR